MPILIRRTAFNLPLSFNGSFYFKFHPLIIFPFFISPQTLPVVADSPPPPPGGTIFSKILTSVRVWIIKQYIGAGSAFNLPPRAGFGYEIQM
jgi:hypothetical protein